MTDTDTLSFSGDSGQLFSITDSLTGTIFAVNDISGVPSIEVIDDGTIILAELIGNILVGTRTDNGIDRLQVNGSVSVSGTVNANGGTLATDQTSFNLVNTTATTGNLFGAASAVNIGATTGTMTLRNPTVVGSQATQNLFNTVATTMNFAGNASAVTVGATSGTMTLRNPTVVGSQAAQTLFNTVATTMNFAGAASAVNIGATSGTMTLRNPTIVGSQATQNLFNTVATTLNIGGASSTFNAGATSGTMTLRNPTIVGSQATQNLFNTVATTGNLFGAGTAITIGATTGTATIRNATTTISGSANINGGTLASSATTFNLVNTTATTGNLFGAATSITIGATTGTTTIRNASTVLSGTLTVNGNNITMAATSTRDKYRVWNDSTYVIGMHNNYTFGALNNDYAMTFQFSNNSSRGFWWGDNVHTNAQGAMALSTDGKLTVANSIRVGFGETDTVLPGTNYTLEVNGSFAATTKSFVIDHPTKSGMKLRYGSLEGPENGVYVRGRLTGSNVIELPDYWTGLVDPESITVNLTAVGRRQDLWVDDIKDNTVVVGGEEVDCFYTVYAERVDVEKLVVELHKEQ
jgi:sorbitol-specific phosphotransferase system component IIA